MAAERSGGCRPFAVVQAPCLRTQERIQPRTCWDLAEFSRRSSQGCRIRDRSWLGRWQFLRSAVPRPASGLRPSASKRTQGRRGGARRSGPPSQVSGLTFSLPCFGGYGFYLLKSKPVFLWNLVDLKRERWEGPALAPGKHLIEFESGTPDSAPARWRSAAAAESDRAAPVCWRWTERRSPRSR
jgi:hypothetical protein